MRNIPGHIVHSSIVGTIAAAAFVFAGVASADEARHEVKELEITILSTMLSERAIGEWGFAALVEADGRRILFDTGNHPETVLQNARLLGIDLGDIDEVILSHNHGDHTGGLVALRKTLMDTDPGALARAHVATGIFWERLGRGRNYEQMTVRKAAYEALGGTFIEHDEATEIHPGIWLTGPVPRVHAEKNYGNPSRPDFARRIVQSPHGPVEDNIPESMSMIINTPKGLVVLSGCGHAGMVNTLEYAQSIVRPAAVHVAIGGYHLLHADDETLDWTAEKLVDIGVENFVGAHCTGIEPVYRFRELLNLDRDQSIVGAVGGKFSLKSGVSATALTR